MRSVFNKNPFVVGAPVKYSQPYAYAKWQESGNRIRNLRGVVIAVRGDEALIEWTDQTRTRHPFTIIERLYTSEPAPPKVDVMFVGDWHVTYKRLRHDCHRVEIDRWSHLPEKKRNGRVVADYGGGVGWRGCAEVEASSASEALRLAIAEARASSKRHRHADKR